MDATDTMVTEQGKLARKMHDNADPNEHQLIMSGTNGNIDCFHKMALIEY